MTLGPESASVSPLEIFSPAGFSIRTTSPAATFSCFPPVRTMAYMGQANRE